MDLSRLHKKYGTASACIRRFHPLYSILLQSAVPVCRILWCMHRMLRTDYSQLPVRDCYLAATMHSSGTLSQQDSCDLPDISANLKSVFSPLFFPLICQSPGKIFLPVQRKFLVSICNCHLLFTSESLFPCFYLNPEFRQLFF